MEIWYNALKISLALVYMLQIGHDVGVWDLDVIMPRSILCTCSL